jgi:hypothetical protein
MFALLLSLLLAATPTTQLATDLPDDELAQSRKRYMRVFVLPSAILGTAIIGTTIVLANRARTRRIARET